MSHFIFAKFILPDHAWRDHYPRQDTTQKWSGVISQELSDMLLGGDK